jgi:hypothetical protein
MILPCALQLSSQLLDLDGGGVCGSWRCGRCSTFDDRSAPFSSNLVDSLQELGGGNAGEDALTAGDEQVGVDQLGVGNRPLIIWTDQPELKCLFCSRLDGLIAQEYFDSIDLDCRQFGLAAH